MLQFCVNELMASLIKYRHLGISSLPNCSGIIFPLLVFLCPTFYRLLSAGQQYSDINSDAVEAILYRPRWFKSQQLSHFAPLLSKTAVFIPISIKVRKAVSYFNLFDPCPYVYD